MTRFIVAVELKASKYRPECTRRDPIGRNRRTRTAHSSSSKQLSPPFRFRSFLFILFIQLSLETMGQTASTAASAPAACPVKHDAAPAKCPVPHNSPSAVSTPASAPAKCPIEHAPAPAQTLAQCPIDHDGTALDPRTQMPTLSQAPAPHQQADLPTVRTESSIPRDDDGARWEYPSPQQFYNALVRKGWETPEEHVQTMVHIHNFLNERAWLEIIKWEQQQNQ